MALYFSIAHLAVLRQIALLAVLTGIEVKRTCIID